jgi:hypothetical protein
MPRNAEECAHRARGLVCGEGIATPEKAAESSRVKKERRKCSLASTARRGFAAHDQEAFTSDRACRGTSRPTARLPKRAGRVEEPARPRSSPVGGQVRLAAHVRPPHNSARSGGVQSREQGHGDSSKCCKHQRALANTKTSTAQCEITIVTVTRTGAKRTSTVHLCR